MRPRPLYVALSGAWDSISDGSTLTVYLSRQKALEAINRVFPEYREYAVIKRVLLADDDSDEPIICNHPAPVQQKPQGKSIFRRRDMPESDNGGSGDEV